MWNLTRFFCYGFIASSFGCLAISFLLYSNGYLVTRTQLNNLDEDRRVYVAKTCVNVFSADFENTLESSLGNGLSLSHVNSQIKGDILRNYQLIEYTLTKGGVAVPISSELWVKFEDFVNKLHISYPYFEFKLEEANRVGSFVISFKYIESDYKELRKKLYSTGHWGYDF